MSPEAGETVDAKLFTQTRAANDLLQHMQVEREVRIYIDTSLSLKTWSNIAIPKLFYE